MTSLPFDLPTLRKHHTYFTINNKRIPTLYRLKSGVYYPYVAFELVQAELEDHCSTWTATRQLPLLPMTVNELLFYKSLCPNSDFSASSTVILCSLIDQLRQLITFLKDTTNTTHTRSRKSFARFSIDANSDSVREIDILNSEATTKYDILRSTLLPSMQNVKRRLCFDDEKTDLASIGGFLQLDQCIYPYIISSSQILLHLNDLRKPFAPTLPTLMPHFHPQPPHLLQNYRKVVEYGTRYIKKYKYYYQNVEDKFISLHQLLSSHRSMFFVQLFNSRKVSLKDLHEYYRSDYAKLITNSIAHCGYLNGQPCVNEWSLSDGTVARENKARLATPNEVLLINWLLIYNDQGVNVHQQAHELVLVKQACSLLNEKIKLLSNEHLRKRSILMNHNAI